MPLNIKRFSRRPFDVDAVRVTEQNMEEVRAWCGGEHALDENNIPNIRVKVRRPIGQRQTRAYIGDWVLLATNGRFKVYTNNSFREFFVPVPTSLEVTNERLRRKPDVFPGEPVEMQEEIDIAAITPKIAFGRRNTQVVD